MASRKLLCFGVLLATAAAQQQQQLCASENTASTSPTTNTFQSVGACTATCGNQYAYAVLQSSMCWCSNVSPDTAVQRSGACHLPCPGYPADICGGAGGLFSYVLLNAAMVQDSKGDDGGAGSDSETPSSTLRTTTPPSHNASPTQQQQPIHVQTTAPNGIIHTITVTPTDRPTSPTSPPTSESITTIQQNPLSTGAIVGIVLGCLCGAALAIAGTACLILSRKRARRGELLDDVSTRQGGSSSDWSAVGTGKNPFVDGVVAPALYGQRDRAGSIETLRPQGEQCLRITNPDPEEK
ncbi:hypothetical protein E4U59_003478 [Claviceps monticola]|nr:hypothetical protein E4U59_003455 [Claviceps monticola]KAG5948147.1 hypothetical protein E4U59_003478 [Claviceps monticola]